MGYQDRPYFRDRDGLSSNPLMWLLYGSVPLFTAFGIRVRCHASLIIMAVLVLALGWGPGFGWQDRVAGMIALFCIILLHEFGHCFTARWVGGDADEILMHPLGGLALAQPPRRPWPTFLTVAGGPAVNVLICLVCGVILWLTVGRLPGNPFYPRALVRFVGWIDLPWYAYWIYEMSYMLLIFNLMPIYPLDGGQMLQTALWKPMGYRRSMLFSCKVGMVCSVIGGMIALATLQLGLALLAGFGLYFCFVTHRAMKYTDEFEELTDGVDYSAAYDINAGRKPKPTRQRDIRRVERLQKDEAIERVRVDAILEQVSAHGMHSLTRGEKRELQKATDRQRKRDIELGLERGGKFRPVPPGSRAK